MAVDGNIVRRIGEDEVSQTCTQELIEVLNLSSVGAEQAVSPKLPQIADTAHRGAVGFRRWAAI
jgi:hypothetical protein